MPIKRKTPAQIEAAKRNLEKARAAKKSRGSAAKAKAKPKPKGRNEYLESSMNRIDAKKNKTPADQKKLDALHKRWKAGRGSGNKIAALKAKKRAESKKRWQPKYTPLSDGVGYEGRQAEKGRGKRYGRRR